MKILVYSPVFYPSIGGLEGVISILAHEFVHQGHEVKLVTKIPDPESTVFPYEVIRQANPKKLLELTKWCDVYFQGHLSLKGIWPALVVGRPIVVTHQGYIESNGSLDWKNHLKHWVTHIVTNICCSDAVAEHLTAPSTVIPNTYRDDIFYEMPEIPRNKELIFLGRLVSNKGADLLLDALANLQQFGMTPKLTIVGSGPEEAKLHQQVKALGISDQVDFVGVKVEKELTQLLNAHQILVVPSRWQEAFGIVALEGIACGCVVIGSEGGGLKDAIGNCGVTFRNNDLKDLTEQLVNLLSNSEKLTYYKTQVESHLLSFKKEKVAQAYLQVFETAIRNNRVRRVKFPSTIQ